MFQHELVWIMSGVFGDRDPQTQQEKTHTDASTTLDAVLPLDVPAATLRKLRSHHDSRTQQ